MKPNRLQVQRVVRENLSQYVLLVVVIIVFLIYVEVYTLHPGDQATMTNTFATVSGVLLGLYFVIRRPEDPQPPLLILFLMISILFSLMSSIASYSDSTFPPPSKGLFVASASTFALSTVYFAITLDMFGKIAHQKK